MTPILSTHARERCAEMKISTKVAKRIVQEPSLTRPGSGGRTGEALICTSETQYAVVYDPRDNLVITVVFRTECDYRREGGDFVEVHSKHS